MEISTSTSGSIILSASHVIFRLSTSGSLESVYAGHLAVGDRLIHLKKGEELEAYDEVVSIKEVVESGFWAPLTSEGTLLVNGFYASCYASFPHELSQVQLSSGQA